MELGTRQPLLTNGGHHISLLSTYGHSRREDLSAHVGNVGVRYEHTFPSGILSLYTGYRQVRGFIGIPGYREVNADPVPFTRHAPEVQLSFSVSR